jgi:hypothetical protein
MRIPGRLDIASDGNLIGYDLEGLVLGHGFSLSNERWPATQETGDFRDRIAYAL